MKVGSPDKRECVGKSVFGCRSGGAGPESSFNKVCCGLRVEETRGEVLCK